MDIQIGDEYLLHIPKDIHSQNIDYIGNITAPRYVKWGEVSGKRVKIKNKLVVMVDYYEAILMQDVTNAFYVTKKMLAFVPKLVVKCKCSLRQLFAGGCNCGAFRQEMLLKGRSLAEQK